MRVRRTRTPGEAPSERADVTLAARMSRRDGAAFVGRARELRIVSEAYADDSPISVLLVHGPAGIGKSAFLREVERRGRRSGWTAFNLAGRDLAEAGEGSGRSLSEAQRVERPLLLVDDCDPMSTVGRRLRREILPCLPARAVVVLAGRQPPEPEWFEGGWETVAFEVPLGPLATHESLALLEKRHIAADRRAADIARWAEGVPRALRMAADAARADPEWVPGDGRAQAAPPAVAHDLPGCVRQALRVLGLPHALAQSPLASGHGIAQRAASVRTLIREAAEHAFGDTADERLLNRVLVRGYLDPAPSHEQAAVELHMSRSTYFRRLKAAAERVAEYVAADAELMVAADPRRPAATHGARHEGRAPWWG